MRRHQLRLLLVTTVAGILLVASGRALANGGTVRRVTDGTVEAVVVVTDPSGPNDRIITRYGFFLQPTPHPGEFDANAILCGARTFQGHTTGTSLRLLDVRREDPLNPGFPDLVGPPIVNANENGQPCPPGFGFLYWTFGAAGVPDPGMALFFTVTLAPQAPPLPATDQCAVGIDTSSGITGRCSFFSSRPPMLFGQLGSNAFIEAIVLEPTQAFDLDARYHGSVRFPGDLGNPIVALRTGGTGILPTTDKVSTTVKIDNPPPIGSVQVDLKIEAIVGAIIPGAPDRDVTRYFRVGGTPGGTRLDLLFPMTLQPGRTLINAAIPAPIPMNFVNRSPSNLPMRTTVTQLSGGTLIDVEHNVFGLRPNPGTHDDGSAEAFFRPRAQTHIFDALAVRFKAIDFWGGGPFTLSAVQIFGRQQTGMGLDAVEVRIQDPVVPDAPDLSRFGLLGRIGLLDGAGEIPLPMGPAGGAVTLDLVPDISIDYSGGQATDIWLVAYFATNDPTNGAEIGADRTFETLLNDSFFSLDGAIPFTLSPQNNFQLRFLLNGAGNPVAPPSQGSAPDRPSLTADRLSLLVLRPSGS